MRWAKGRTRLAVVEHATTGEEALAVPVESSGVDVLQVHAQDAALDTPFRDVPAGCKTETKSNHMHDDVLDEPRPHTS
jgi:protein tyrosine phosphatase (PTP) superfamily phosphohydrolase (DUF442 family)